MARLGTISSRISSLLDPSELDVFRNLRTPEMIQDYLDSLPINFEDSGETYYSVRRVLAQQSAHCLEGAIFAAAVLGFHGEKPLLMDFQTLDDDQDHVVALFKRRGLWGAISKTNHAVLRFRDPVYTTPRELAMSYFHEYFTQDGTKTLAAYSAPFDLSRFKLERWLTAEEDLHWLAGEIDTCKHFRTAPLTVLRSLRKAQPIEVDASYHIEWKSQGIRALRGEREHPDRRE